MVKKLEIITHFLDRALLVLDSLCNKLNIDYEPINV